ncbi:hypothetical protein LMG28614_02562 [Paraburkholderia ultramafica]|uniref:Uncharacterized protein n=1 Tax=Paraburkholderia ultramafica TaxID=1544867 RepID=A0A6S7BGA8_9BURK|nr:hypothetical protein [Paraburkholderia ultramafica]CAB3787747.1 hypothetical protein LMG28614_02562 [Paraburkholderia ultramafica]
MANDTDLPQSEPDGPDPGSVEADGLYETNASPPRFGRLVLCVSAAGALAFGVVGTVAYGVWFNHDQQAYAEAMTGARQALGVPAAASGAAAASMAAKSAASTRPPVPAAAPRTAATTTAPAPAPAPATTGTVVTAAPANAAPAPRVAAATSSTPPTTAPISAQATSTPSTAQTALESDGEEGSKQAVWSGPVAQVPAASAQATLADATPAASATAAPSLRSSRRATNPADPAAQQSAAGRAGKDARLAPQERRASAANARHKNSLFARMGLFFRRVSYRQHDNGRQQQDIYSHP